MQGTMYYYVYYLPPRMGIPEWHYALFAFDLPADEYPDNRYYTPGWTYCTDPCSYEPLGGYSYKKPGTMKRLRKKISEAFRKWIH